MDQRVSGQALSGWARAQPPTVGVAQRPDGWVQEVDRCGSQARSVASILAVAFAGPDRCPEWPSSRRGAGGHRGRPTRPKARGATSPTSSSTLSRSARRPDPESLELGWGPVRRTPCLPDRQPRRSGWCGSSTRPPPHSAPIRTAGRARSGSYGPMSSNGPAPRENRNSGLGWKMSGPIYCMTVCADNGSPMSPRAMARRAVCIPGPRTESGATPSNRPTAAACASRSRPRPGRR